MKKRETELMTNLYYLYRSRPSPEYTIHGWEMHHIESSQLQAFSPVIHLMKYNSIISLSPPGKYGRKNVKTNHQHFKDKLGHIMVYSRE